MIRKTYVPFLMGLFAVVISSCSSKLGELSSDLFTMSPQVLETVAGQVPVTINGKFPEYYFKKKGVLEVTPVLKWNGGEVKGQTVTFQGEKIQGNDQTVPYAAGTNFNIRALYNYVPEMANSELYLEFTDKTGNKVRTLPSVKIGDGVISTAELLKNTLKSSNLTSSADAFQRIIKEAQQANIMFLIQQANLRASELNSAGMKNFNQQLKEVNAAENKKIGNIEISAYASPDGGMDLNTRLAREREANTETQMKKQLKADKMQNIVLDTKYTAEDWDGFQELVAQSNIQDKELILRVLSMYKDPEQREREIKNISAVYKTLADEILPQLRRSRLTLNYEIIGKSDAEITELANANPSKLTPEELLYAATLTNNASKQEAIYNSVMKLFPNEYRAYNNAGVLNYTAGNFEKAESLFQKAMNLMKSAPEVNSNMGLISMLKNDNTAAESYFGKAAGAAGLGEALGNLLVAKGQYDQASASFGNAKSNSAALAQILAKDYNKAKNTLSEVSNPDAYTDYLMAVVGARTNNSSMLFSSLKKAIQEDSSLVQKALADIEFAKYRTDSEFKSLLK